MVQKKRNDVEPSFSESLNFHQRTGTRNSQTGTISSLALRKVKPDRTGMGE